MTTTIEIFLNHLVTNNYTAATDMFPAELQAAMSHTPLQMMIAGKYGEMLDFSLQSTAESDGILMATVTANHTKGDAVHQVYADATGAILGLAPLRFNFNPSMPPANATYTAEAVTIGKGTTWEVEGLLTMPQSASKESPVPAIMLIPGSGANNMDASLFQNRPFFDMADYLSSNGIAVLRYNERTFTHGVQVGQVFGANITMQEEYIEDALLAAEILRADSRISEFFLLGHSLGGIIAPKIAELAKLDGVVLMASSPRPLHQIWYDQSVNATKDSLAAGTISQEEATAALGNLDTQLAEAKEMLKQPAEQLKDVLLFGAFPAIYEQSVIESLPLPIIEKNTDIPVLILQGERDFQTTVADDFQVFLDGTAGMAHVTTRLYAELNHLMMTAQRQEGPLVVDVMEYATHGKVDAQVLRDIADFIRGAFNG